MQQPNKVLQRARLDVGCFPWGAARAANARWLGDGISRKCHVNRILLGLVLAISGCSAEDPALTTFPIPAQAGEVEEIEIGEVIKITSFVVKAKYPDTTVFEFYRERIAPPWVVCKIRSRWDSFSDESGGNPAYVHTLWNSWVNVEAGRLLMIILTYESDGGSPREVPDNDNLSVELREVVDDELAHKLSTGTMRCQST